MINSFGSNVQASKQRKAKNIRFLMLYIVQYATNKLLFLFEIHKFDAWTVGAVVHSLHHSTTFYVKNMQNKIVLVIYYMGCGWAFNFLKKKKRKQHPDHIVIFIQCAWMVESPPSPTSTIFRSYRPYNNHKINNASHKHNVQSSIKQIIMKIESGKLKRKLQLSCGFRLGLRAYPKKRDKIQLPPLFFLLIQQDDYNMYS